MSRLSDSHPQVSEFLKDGRHSGECPAGDARGCSAGQRIMGKKRAEQSCRQHLVFRFRRGQCLGSLYGRNAKMEAVSRDPQPSWEHPEPSSPSTGEEQAFKMMCRAFMFCEGRNPHRSDPLTSPPPRIPAGTVTAQLWMLKIMTTFWHIKPTLPSMSHAHN